MEEIVQLLTITLAGIAMWCAATAIALGLFLTVALKKRGRVRITDMCAFVGTTCIAILGGVVVLGFPNLIATIPSTFVAIEVSCLPFLYHLTELEFKHLNQVVKSKALS